MIETAAATTPPGWTPGLAGIRLALSETLTRPTNEVEGRSAAVAAVLRECGGDVELLFIRRARRRGDPWSGHMAWPGGKRELSDGSPVACAVRETREELGLDLDQAGELLGSLREWRSRQSGPRGLQAVFAYVFALRRAVELHPGPEVQEAVWIPLSYFAQWSSRRPWAWVGRWLPVAAPAYRYQGRLIWGLTLWLLADLLQRLAEGRERGPVGMRPPR